MLVSFFFVVLRGFLHRGQSERDVVVTYTMKINPDSIRKCEAPLSGELSDDETEPIYEVKLLKGIDVLEKKFSKWAVVSRRGRTLDDGTLVVLTIRWKKA